MRFCLLLFFVVLAAFASLPLRLRSLGDDGRSSFPSSSSSSLLNSFFHLLDPTTSFRGISSIDDSGCSLFVDPNAPLLLLLLHQRGRDGVKDYGKSSSSSKSSPSSSDDDVDVPSAIDARRHEQRVLLRSTTTATTEPSSSHWVRKPGQYRDIFTLHVKLLPSTTLEGIHDHPDDASEGKGGGGGDSKDVATAHGELVIVTDTVVTKAGTEGGLPQVELMHQEVTSRAAATTVTTTAVTQEEPTDEPSSSIEVCHATTSTQAQFKKAGRLGILLRGALASTTIGTGNNQFLRGRRLLSLPSPRDENPFQDDDPRCASLLSAVVGGADEFRSSHVQRTSREGPIPPAIIAAITTTNRYLDAIPFHAVQPGDSWPVMLSSAVPSHLGGAGSSLTGIATFLGYQSPSICGGRPNVEHTSTTTTSSRQEGPRIAVIQVRGTTIEGSGAGASAANDVAVAKLYFDVPNQIVRYVTVDQRFVLHTTKSRDGDGNGDGTADRTVTIPVRGTVVMETLWVP